MFHPSHSSLIFQIFTSGLDKHIAKSSKRLRIFKNASDCAKSCAGQPKTISRYSCLKQEENYIWPKSLHFLCYQIQKILNNQDNYKQPKNNNQEPKLKGQDIYIRERKVFVIVRKKMRHKLEHVLLNSIFTVHDQCCQCDKWSRT